MAPPLCCPAATACPPVVSLVRPPFKARRSTARPQAISPISPQILRCNPSNPRVNIIIHCAVNKKGKGRNYEFTRKTMPPLKHLRSPSSYLLSVLQLCFVSSQWFVHEASKPDQTPYPASLGNPPASLCAPNMLPPSEQRRPTCCRRVSSGAQHAAAE